MGGFRVTRGALTAGVTVLLVVLLGYAFERTITTRAFDRLEAAQAAQDAGRLRIALDAETRVLRNYGATNSIWDDSYAAVKATDTAGFTAAFPPADAHSLYGLDGILGVGSDGRLRAGGLARGTDAFTAPPAELSDPAVLRTLFVPGGRAGQARCGIVSSASTPFLFCGFPAYDSASQGPPSGGLVYLVALDAARWKQLGKQIELPLQPVTRVRPGAKEQSTLDGSFGSFTVSTSTPSERRAAVDAVLPTVNGDRVLVEISRPRPIHRMATNTATLTLILMLATGVLLLGVVAVLVRRGTREQVNPLRRTAEAIVDSGDRGLRVNATGTGEIAALGRAIDGMLDTLARQDADLRRAQAVHEADVQANFHRAQQAEKDVRQRAQAIIDDSVRSVVAELHEVIDQVAEVRGSAATIDERVSVATEATTSVASHAQRADQAIQVFGESLRQVGGAATQIATVAGQTKLLALNATIEAARAGPAGAGFGVVADEVKDLASATASTTERIDTTIASLESNAADVTTAIDAMTAGIGDIDATAVILGGVATDQRALVENLNRRLHETIDRIEQMTALTNRLERRQFPRVSVALTGTLRAGGRAYPVRLHDLSEGGARCQLETAETFGPSIPVELDVTLADHHLVLRGEPLQHEQPSTEVRLRFAGLTSPDAGAIRAYLAAAADRT